METDSDRERFQASLRALPDDELVDTLLALTKLCDLRAREDLAELQRLEGSTVLAAPERFAPVTLQQALDRWEAALNEEGGSGA